MLLLDLLLHERYFTQQISKKPRAQTVSDLIVLYDALRLSSNGPGRATPGQAKLGWAQPGWARRCPAQTQRLGRLACASFCTARHGYKIGLVEITTRATTRRAIMHSVFLHVGPCQCATVLGRSRA